MLPGGLLFSRDLRMIRQMASSERLTPAMEAVDAARAVAAR